MHFPSSPCQGGSALGTHRALPRSDDHGPDHQVDHQPGGQQGSGLDADAPLTGGNDRRRIPADRLGRVRNSCVKACIGLAVPGRPIGPWSRRTEAPQASADRTGPGAPRSALVRGAPDHKGTSGQQRSQRARGNRSSPDLRLRQLARHRRPYQIVVPKAGGSSPSPNCRRPAVLVNQAGSH
jgi:hypothetical protein